jgi:hypothetical protein
MHHRRYDANHASGPKALVSFVSSHRGDNPKGHGLGRPGSAGFTIVMIILAVSATYLIIRAIQRNRNH